MKFDGRPIERYHGTVTLVRGEGADLHRIDIRVRQLPAGWLREREQMLPEPLPPVVGKEFDSDGKSRPKYDTENQAYKDARVEWDQRCLAKLIVDATVDDRLKFETPRDLLQSDPVRYYSEVHAELAAAFTDGELGRWRLVVHAIDQVGGADVALAEEGLFPAVQRLLEVRDMEKDAAEV